MTEIFKHYTFYLADGIEAFSALIITMAALQATFQSMLIFCGRSPKPEQQKIDVRLKLGRWLSLGLEFLLAADILRTAIAPTWEEIGKLAAIAVLRTFLNYFLEREIGRADAENEKNVASNKIG